MSIPDPTQPSAPSGWYPTGETGPDGMPVERWWDGAAWSAMVRPVGSGDLGGPAAGGRRGSAFKGVIVAAVMVVLVGIGVGVYFAVNGTNSGTTASTGSQPTTGPTGNGGFGGGNGGLGGGNGGLGGGSTSSPAPQTTVTGGSGQTVADPIDGLNIPVPSGWTGTAGSTSGSGAWPSLSTGPYTCPSALASENAGGSGSTAAPQCTRGGVNFTTTKGSSSTASAQSVVTADIASLAKGNYGTLTSHTVTSQGAVNVAGRSGYQITWSVVPNYAGPSGTVEVIALPIPGQSGYFALIDIGVDQSSQAPSLATVNSQIISGITDSSAAGA